MGSFKLKFLVIAVLFIGVILIFRMLFIPGNEINAPLIPEMSVNPASVVVEKGKEFSIDISIDPANNPISAAQFSLFFNGSIINIKDVTEGGFFKQKGEKTAFNSGTLDRNLGALVNIWGLIITPGAIVTMKGNIVTITMSANNTGTSQLILRDVIISNQAGKSIHTKVTNGSVEVKG
jgi:hypothetical protein